MDTIGLIERIPNATNKKWRATYDNGLTKIFTTKNKAADWLLLMYENPHAVARLLDLRGPWAQGVNVRQFNYNWTRTDHDKGFGAVLTQLAKALGYRFRISEPSRNKAARIPSVGIIDYDFRTIWITPNACGIGRTHILAHELAHEVERYEGIRLPKKAREQVVDAVAAAVLFDNGIDLVDGTLRYIDEYRTLRYNFFRGDLDETFVVLYNAYTETLKNFLQP